MRQLQRDLRHQEIALDVAWEYATLLGKRQGLEEKALDDRIEKSINDAIRNDDAEIARASRQSAKQQTRATPASAHKPSSVQTTPEPKVAKAVSADHQQDEVQAFQKRTRSQEDGWDEGH